jgi:hypothetical protein
MASLGGDMAITVTGSPPPGTVDVEYHAPLGR